MKIVINGCHGGFGLSPLGVKRLAELQGRECHFFVNDCKPDGQITRHEVSLEEAENSFMWFAYDTADQTLTQKEWDQSHSLYARDLERDDPLLIQIIEELGKKASGEHAKLKIVEIPDGVDYEIEEYDGYEHIAEKHRTWC